MPTRKSKPDANYSRPQTAAVLGDVVQQEETTQTPPLEVEFCKGVWLHHSRERALLSTSFSHLCHMVCFQETRPWETSTQAEDPPSNPWLAQGHGDPCEQMDGDQRDRTSEGVLKQRWEWLICAPAFLCPVGDHDTSSWATFGLPEASLLHIISSTLPLSHPPWGHPPPHQSPHLQAQHPALHGFEQHFKCHEHSNHYVILSLNSFHLRSQLWIGTRHFFKLHFLGMHLQDKALWSRHPLTCGRVRK